MKTKKYWFLTTVLGICALVTLLSITAWGNEAERSSLSGVMGISVVVEEVSEAGPDEIEGTPRVARSQRQVLARGRSFLGETEQKGYPDENYGPVHLFSNHADLLGNENNLRKGLLFHILHHQSKPFGQFFAENRPF